MFLKNSKLIENEEHINRLVQENKEFKLNESTNKSEKEKSAEMGLKNKILTNENNQLKEKNKDLINTIEANKKQIDDQVVTQKTLSEGNKEKDEALAKMQKEMQALKDKSEYASKALKALLPLKTKLTEETNPAKKEVAKKMISDMEEAILLHLEGKTNIKEFQKSFVSAIATATPVLNQQSDWKNLIDYVANIIYNLLPNAIKNQATSEKRFSLFANPNLLQKEITQAENEITTKLVQVS